MKKNLILGMAALLGMSLAFTACSSDDDPAGSAAVNDNAIGFSVLTNNAAGTRATAITPKNVNNEMKNFVVWGTYSTGGSYYLGTQSKGIQFNNTNGTWDYADQADLKYWPTDETHTLDFYAISPASAINNVYNPGHKGFFYAAPTDNTQQIDVMDAILTGKKKSDATSEGKVTLNFKHQLSQIVFKAKSVSNTLEVEINKITIHRVISSASFNYTGDKMMIAYTADANEDYPIGMTSPVSVPATGEVVDVTTKSGDDYTGALLLIPQTLTAYTTGTIANANANNECYIEIEAKYKSGNEYLLGSANAYGTTYIGLGGKWEAGKKYIYTLAFGAKDGGGVDPNGDPTVTPIGFNVEVADWTDSTSDINL